MVIGPNPAELKGKNERTGDFDLGKLAVNRRQFVDDGYSGATLVTKTSLAPEWARGGLAICSKGFWSVLKTDTLITEKPRDREAQVVSKIIAAPARMVIASEESESATILIPAFRLGQLNIKPDLRRGFSAQRVLPHALIFPTNTQSQAPHSSWPCAAGPDRA